MYINKGVLIYSSLPKEGDEIAEWVESTYGNKKTAYCYYFSGYYIHRVRITFISGTDYECDLIHNIVESFGPPEEIDVPFTAPVF